jgi:hypothetical protein
MVRHMLSHDAVGIARIAKEAGLSRQTVYRIKDDPAAAEAALAHGESEADQRTRQIAVNIDRRCGRVTADISRVGSRQGSPVISRGVDSCPT